MLNEKSQTIKGHILYRLAVAEEQGGENEGGLLIGVCS
jgi:hypothetical protein